MSHKTVAEIIAFKRLITEVHSSGVVSIVSDTFSYWDVLAKIAPVLKVNILNRKPNMLGLAKTVFRPDSGDPVEILCGIETYSAKSLDEAEEIAKEMFYDLCDHGERGLDSETYVFEIENTFYNVTVSPWWNRHDKQYYYIDGWQETQFEKVELTPEQKGSVQALWDIFGGTITETGHKLLDSHVGLIYGDSITLDRAYKILDRLERKGFASGNVVFGIGSFTYQYNTRDTFGMAMKATYAVVNSQGRELFKDPKTDDGTKKSAKGLLRVDKVGDTFKVTDMVSEDEEKLGELRSVFKDGKLLVDENLSDIRNRLNSYLKG